MIRLTSFFSSRRSTKWNWELCYPTQKVILILLHFAALLSTAKACYFGSYTSRDSLALKENWNQQEERRSIVLNFFARSFLEEYSIWLFSHRVNDGFEFKTFYFAHRSWQTQCNVNCIESLVIGNTMGLSSMKKALNHVSMNKRRSSFFGFWLGSNEQS